MDETISINRLLRYRYTNSADDCGEILNTSLIVNWANDARAADVRTDQAKQTNKQHEHRSGQIDVGKRLTAWSVELLLYGTGIKRSCNSPPITFKSKGQR